MNGTSDGKEHTDVQPAVKTKPLWRRANLMVAFRDAMKHMKNNKKGVNTKTIAKFISQQSDTPPMKILPRLNDVIRRAECMGMVTKVASGTYILEEKEIDLCGKCGGMKRRKRKSRCGSKRKRSRSRRKRSCGKKRRSRSRRKRSCGKKRRSRSRRKSRCGKKRRSRSRRKSRCGKKRRSRSRRSRCGKKKRRSSCRRRC
ncbi:hypothetical protein GE061_002795 [Apolygus lucorum]|uniref:Uncharacterized protein n=1 Tax=Apolygus lucorum TaxID=248454 RepID=A0A6A4KER9_APOLU|nr:hypothetical protein GE061_002795 [Apolygus lucorum]